MSYFPSQEAYVADWYPDGKTNYAIGDTQPIHVDVGGNLICRSAVLTDEGSFYEPFAGSTLPVAWTSVVGTGGSVSVANSICSIVCGTTAAVQTYIYRQTDYPPLTFTFILSISQRIANQDIYFGYGDSSSDPTTDTMFARFHFYGTDNTRVSCETQSSADTGGSEGLNTQIILPIGANTAALLLYRIENDGKKVRFFVGKTLDTLVLLVTYSTQIPNPYTVMYQRVRCLNGTTPATSTTISVDTIACSNFNIVDTSVAGGGTIGVTQTVTASVVNSSTTNLTAGGNSRTFTGLTESALFVSGIQVALFADQNCFIKVQQSPDGSNWDITDQYAYQANASFGVTIQSVSSYFRVVVTSLADTTVFRLQSCLTPITEPLPRALDPNGNLTITNPEDLNGIQSFNTPTGEQRTISPVRLIGADFEGYTIDPSFWIAASAGAGASVSQAGGTLTLVNGTGAAGTVTCYSVRRARYVGGISNRYRGVIQLGDTGTANNTRRWGAAYIANYNFTISGGTPTVGNTYSNNSQYFTCLWVNGATIHCYGTGAPTATGTLTFVSGPGAGNLTYTAFAAEAVPTDGAWFQVSGTTFSIVTMIAGSPSTVSSGSFNGYVGYNYALTTNVATYEIYWTNSSVWFMIGSQLLHKFSAVATDWSNALSLQVFQDSINVGAATSVSMKVRVATIARMGVLTTLPIYRSITSAATTVCKYGGGTLQSILVNTPTAGTITLYDNFAAVGPTFAVLTTTAGISSEPFATRFDCPFFNGLTVVTSATVNITVVYE